MGLLNMRWDGRPNGGMMDRLRARLPGGAPQGNMAMPRGFGAGFMPRGLMAMPETAAPAQPGPGLPNLFQGGFQGGGFQAGQQRPPMMQQGPMPGPAAAMPANEARPRPRRNFGMGGGRYRGAV